MQHRVSWEIDVDAKDPRDAAQQARDAQLRPGTLATVFSVFRDNHYCDTIDLGEQDRGQNPKETA